MLSPAPSTEINSPASSRTPRAFSPWPAYSELGPRWIYDAETDPVWRAQLLRFVRDGDAAALRSPDGVVDDAVRGRALDPARLSAVPDDNVTIELRRVLPSRPMAPETHPAGAAGLLSVTYRSGAGTGDPDLDTVTALVAVIR